MAQYATVILRTKSKNAPDFGLGQGVIASKLVKLSDDDGMAGIQMHEVWQDMVNENLKMDYEEATEVYWDNAKDEEDDLVPWKSDYVKGKTEQDILISFLEMLHPEEVEDGLGYSHEPEEMRGDRIWYKEHYAIPNHIDWIGQFVYGIGQWDGEIFLFDKNNKFIGRAIRKPKGLGDNKEYKFDDLELKYVIGPENYKKYFGKEK